MSAGKTWGPFNGRQLTVIVVAAIAGFVLLPGAVWAVDTFSNVAIQDPVSGNKASVDATHKVLVGDGAGSLTVDGTVSALPSTGKSPFSLNALSFADGQFTSQMAPTSATLAITDIRIANVTTSPMTVTIYQYAGSSCNSSTSLRFVGQWIVPGSTTLVEPLTTPLVLKPPNASTMWCLGTYASNGTNSGAGFWINYGGFVTAGTFSASPFAPTKEPQNPSAAPTRSQAVTP